VSRPNLTRDRILDAAVTLADEGGLGAVSMRKVGQQLGVEAMSLYNHVANKSDLLNGMVDRVAAEFEPPRDGDWTSSLRQTAITAHEALTRHPWACDLMMSPDHVSVTRIQHMDALLRALREAGFTEEQTYHAYHILDAHIFGFSLWLAGHSLPANAEELVKDFRREFPMADYPDFATHVEQHMSGGPHKGVNAFELGLDLILDGLTKIRGEG
jgi:AcrR family transcriptional regulator